MPTINLLSIACNLVCGTGTRHLQLGMRKESLQLARAGVACRPSGVAKMKSRDDHTMNVTLFRALVALVPACMLFCGSIVLFFRGKTVSSFLQLLGAGCLVVVVLTHVSEALRLFPWMHWGSSTALVTTWISGVLFLVSRCFP
jgi:uncharacterized protein (DUF983 family)